MCGAAARHQCPVFSGQGFEEEMRDIIDILPRTRQTMLFSATQTTKVCHPGIEGGGNGETQQPQQQQQQQQQQQ